MGFILVLAVALALALVPKTINEILAGGSGAPLAWFYLGLWAGFVTFIVLLFVSYPKGKGITALWFFLSVISFTVILSFTGYVWQNMEAA